MCRVQIRGQLINVGGMNHAPAVILTRLPEPYV
jgi:hypothetical protein